MLSAWTIRKPFTASGSPSTLASPFALTMIAGRGSGECLDRQEALQASAEVQTGTYDLVIAEDLGRIFRRIHAQLFCELCEDVGTRLVAINHHVDTERDDWRMHAFFATMRHEMYNADTAKRIRRTMHAVLTEVLTNADLLATLRPILPTAPPESTTDTPTLPKGVFRRACDGLKAATGTACAAAAVAALLRARQPDLLAFEADPTASFLALS